MFPWVDAVRPAGVVLGVLAQPGVRERMGFHNPAEAVWLPLGHSYPRRRLIDLADSAAWISATAGPLAS